MINYYNFIITPIPFSCSQCLVAMCMFTATALWQSALNVLVLISRHIKLRIEMKITLSWFPSDFCLGHAHLKMPVASSDLHTFVNIGSKTKFPENGSRSLFECQTAYVTVRSTYKTRQPQAQPHIVTNLSHLEPSGCGSVSEF